jgi:hypothetical protein
MVVADVLMVFEGAHTQHLSLHAPSRAHEYPASAFEYTSYAISGPSISRVSELVTSSDPRCVHVTDESGGNPYARLPN